MLVAMCRKGCFEDQRVRISGSDGARDGEVDEVVD